MVVVLVLVLAFFAGGGWLYAGQIRDGALASKAPGTPAGSWRKKASPVYT